MTTSYRKKLIEVALPLQAINDACIEEKAVPRHGHPATLHLWWARRPLAAARAVLLAQMIDDPSSCPERFPTEAAQQVERQRLFELVGNLARWDSAGDSELLRHAWLEIARTHARGAKEAAEARGVIVDPDILMREPDDQELLDYLRTSVPAVHDPFAGGGSIPLEAKRLGLRSIATDLNPVATFLNAVQIDLPSRFAGAAPLTNTSLDPSPPSWPGFTGLAEEVRQVGARVRERALALLGPLYEPVDLPRELGGGKATPIAWLWARTVPSPDPNVGGAHTPLVSNIVLSEKPDRAAHLDLVVDAQRQAWSPVVRPGAPSATAKRTKAGRAAFRCVFSGTPIDAAYIRSQAQAGRLGLRLLAVVAQKGRRRFYVTPAPDAEQRALTAKPVWEPDTDLPHEALGFRVQNYGVSRHAELFLPRQMAALAVFASCIREETQIVESAACKRFGDEGGSAYATCVAAYLACALSKMADWLSMYCGFIYGYEKFGHTFGKQTLSMLWDFAELNPFSDAVGNWTNHVGWVADAVAALPCEGPAGLARLADASRLSEETVGSDSRVFTTDPPYYDNIGYADLSDFFYIWLRHVLHERLPDLFPTLLVPKSDELIASPSRFEGSRDAARDHFESGLRRTFARMRALAHADYPITIYYAFKQAESQVRSDGKSHASTGWEAMLAGLVDSGFEITGTWPVRSERTGRLRDIGSNALASSVVLVCRPRRITSIVSRAELIRELRRELPAALTLLQRGGIAPVDLAQAAIGPGMRIYSAHSSVIEADGTPMAIRAALALINEILDEQLEESEGSYDPDTRWAVTWFEQHGYDEGAYGEAENLARARNVSVSGIAHAGIIKSAAGKVRLLKREELRPLDYDPAKDERPTVWEYTQHLIRNLEHEGETAAAVLLKMLGPHAETARALAYRLYNACERRKWAEEARAYNGLVIAWPELEKIAASGRVEKAQTALDLGEDD